MNEYSVWRIANVNQSGCGWLHHPQLWPDPAGSATPLKRTRAAAAAPTGLIKNLSMAQWALNFAG
jgi:hypothetical protein